MTAFLIHHLVKDSQNTQNPTVRSAYGSLAGKVGLVCNALLCVAKFVVGTLFGSISITADAINNLSDASSSVITLVGFKLSERPADKEHPYGHARIEYLAGLAVAVMILVIGIELAKTSIGKMIAPTDVEFSFITVIVLLGSIGVKLWMAFFNRDVGKRIGSATLQATAVDSRNDVITTTAVLAGAIAGALSGRNFDGWLGLGVALFIVYSGFGLIKDTANPLLGSAPSLELTQHIATKILSYEGVLGTHDLLLHDYGPGRRFGSVHVEMDAAQDVMASHNIIDNIERDFWNTEGLHFVIHYDPILVGDEASGTMRNWMEQKVKSISPQLALHDFRMVQGPQHTNLIFDVVTPQNFPLSDTQLKQRIQNLVESENTRYYTVVTVDESFAPIYDEVHHAEESVRPIETPKGIDMDLLFSNRMAEMKPSIIREILKQMSDPALISFAGGNPAAQSFPAQEIAQFSAQLLEQDPVGMLQYSLTEGVPGVRTAVRSFVNRHGAVASESDALVMMSGSQQILEFVTKCLCNEGDVVAVENPAFLGAYNAFRSHGAVLAGVEMEEDGVHLAQLEAVFSAAKKPKFFYCIPNFQNPTGKTMSLEKRKAVYALSVQYGVPVLEDDPYGALRIAGHALPPIKSFDTQGAVIYAGSFSKILCPGMRLAYCICQKPLMDKLVIAKQCSDVHTNVWAQRVCEQMLVHMDMDAHIADLTKLYRDKAQRMMAKLDALCPHIDYVRPEGGMFIWATLPQGLCMADFVQTCLAKKLALVPGNAFRVDEKAPCQSFRMNFSTPSLEQIDAGVAIMAQVLQAMQRAQ